MQYYYVVLENGETYPHIYVKYIDAVNSVKMKHKSYLEERFKEDYDLHSIEGILSMINVTENSKGTTNLYIEKGINIEIHKLYVLQ